MVRMEHGILTSCGIAPTSDRQHHDFVKLSPYLIDDTEMTRLLFLDADYIRRHESTSAPTALRLR